jgi:SNF2 family DNA or RNA helicase
VDLLFWEHYADAHVGEVFLAGLESSGYSYRAFLEAPAGLAGYGTKTAAAMALLTKLIGEDPGSTVLVFTQFVDHQVLLESLCRARGWSVGRLYGDMKDSLREASIDAARRGTFQVYLAMLQCACTGLNLQDAGYRMVFLEPSWTPALEEQGIGRMHRLGQQRPVVQVYRMYAADTVEARALDIQDLKVDLIEGLMGTDDGLRAKMGGQGSGSGVVAHMFQQTFGITRAQ